MSKSYELTGRLHVISETKSYGDNDFRKREFVVLITGADTNPDYPDYVSLNFTKDKCDILNGYGVGQDIKVHFNIGGREWQKDPSSEKKYFNDLQAWKIEALSQQAPAQQKQEEPAFESGF